MREGTQMILATVLLAGLGGRGSYAVVQSAGFQCPVTISACPLILSLICPRPPPDLLAVEIDLHHRHHTPRNRPAIPPSAAEPDAAESRHRDFKERMAMANEMSCPKMGDGTPPAGIQPEEHRRRVVMRRQQSGLTKAAFCARKRIRPSA